MDSLLAVRFRVIISQLFQRASPTFSIEVPKNVVYDHPSINALTEYVTSSLSLDKVNPSSEDDISTRFKRVVDR